MVAIIDTHHHLWDLERLELPWVSSIPQLNRSFRMPDYLTAVHDQAIAATVYMEVNVVEAQHQQEIDYVTALCEDADNPMQGAVVAGEPAAADFEEYVAKLKGNPWVKGVRRVLHPPDMPPGECLRDEFVRGVQNLGEQGLIFDICIRPAELQDAVALVTRCPQTTFVIDHCGNADPYVVSGARPPGSETPDKVLFFPHAGDGWRRAMQALADQPNTNCKISGIVARANESWTPADLAPTVDFCLDVFGDERVVFGGDWPVCTLGAAFHQWADALRTIIQDRPGPLQNKLLHENARRLYGLPG